MANDDKLWFELGVRDNVSMVLEKLLRDSKDLEGAFDKLSESLDDMLEHAFNRNNKAGEFVTNSTIN